MPSATVDNFRATGVKALASSCVYLLAIGRELAVSSKVVGESPIFEHIEGDVGRS